MSTPAILADTNRVALRYVRETSWGVAPATPTLQAMRFTGHSLKHNKAQVASTEIRSDRQVADIIQTGVTTDGTLNIEMSHATHEDFILAVLGATSWTLVQMHNITMAVATQTAGLTTVTTSTSPIAAGVTIGSWQFLQNTGFGGGLPIAFKVTAVTSGDFTVEDPGALITGISGTSQVSSKYAANGVSKPSFTIEEVFSDIASSYVVFNGMRIDKWTLNINAQKIMDGSFDFFGQQATIGSSTIATAVTSQTTTPSISASADVGALLLNGAPSTAGITKIQFMLKNNMRHRPVVGQKYDDDHGYGKCDVTCAITALVPDLTLFQASINHSDFSLDIPMFDELGNGTVIVIPKMKVTGNPAVGGENQDVTIDLNGEAKRDPVTGSTVIIYTYTPSV